MTPRIGAIRLPVFLIVAVAAFLAPPTAMAHAELVSSTPADGETVTGNPPMINARYSETLDPDGSSLALLDPSGARTARGGVVGARNTPKQMWIETLPPLEPGVYTVRSTTRSAQDGDIDRTTWKFTVVAAPSPTAAPPSAEPTLAASPTPTAIATPSAVASPSPSPGPGPTSGTGGDVILPILAALALVALGGSYLVARGRRTGSSR